MDPLSLILAGAAAGGVAGKLAELFTGYLGDLLRGQDRTTQEAAAENAAAFLAKLVAQIQTGAQTSGNSIEVRVEPALTDPDFATTVRTALVGAARTANPDRHAILARAVTERLSAEPESIEAVASNLAVEVVPRLSQSDLQLLGLAAVTYNIRPTVELLIDRVGVSDGSQNEQAGWQPSTEFVTWFRRAVTYHALGTALSDINWVHLVSASCVVYERKLLKNLHRTLQHHMVEILDHRAQINLARDIAHFLHLDPIGRDLAGLWKAGLQHTTLTPVGLLIGTAVHETKSGELTPVNWHTATGIEGNLVADVVWDGERISERFLKVLDRAVRDRAERGIGIWRNLDQ